jgi:hypothetical protein
MGEGLMSERELNSHACDLRRRLSDFHVHTKNRRSETYDVCPRSDTHLTYMIDIALTTEFSTYR